ncbi:hypothetical protein AB205_0068870, partial [Aquarana catesbeiana]
DLIDFSAEEEQPGEPPAEEELLLGPNFTVLCPALIASSGFQGQEMVNLYPQTRVAETGDLIDFSAEEEQPGEPPPEEELLLGTNFTMLCPAPTELSVKLQGTSPAEALAIGQRVQDLCPTPAIRIEGEKGEEVFVVPPQQLAGADGVGFPAEGLATGLSTAGLCPQLTEDGCPVKVDGTLVSTCIPQGCWAVGPDPQQYDGVSPDTLSSLQRQKGLQGEEPVQASPQRQICSLKEAEVGWVSNTLFGTICLGYCVGTGIRGLKLLTNFRVNPSGVSSCVSLLLKGEKCDRPSRERDFWRDCMLASC